LFLIKIVLGYGNKNLQLLFTNVNYTKTYSLNSIYGTTHINGTNDGLFKINNLDYEYELVNLICKYSDYDGWYSENEKLDYHVLFKNEFYNFKTTQIIENNLI
jgi:hypothetical protein